MCAAIIAHSQIRHYLKHYSLFRERITEHDKICSCALCFGQRFKCTVGIQNIEHHYGNRIIYKLTDRRYNEVRHVRRILLCILHCELQSVCGKRLLKIISELGNRPEQLILGSAINHNIYPALAVNKAALFQTIQLFGIDYGIAESADHILIQ